MPPAHSKHGLTFWGADAALGGRCIPSLAGGFAADAQYAHARFGRASGRCNSSLSTTLQFHRFRMSANAMVLPANFVAKLCLAATMSRNLGCDVRCCSA